MPTIALIEGVKIMLYSREHPPPHFHAVYAEFEELIEIETFATYVGKIPLNKRKKVIEWAVENQSLLRKVFKQLNPNL